MKFRYPMDYLDVISQKNIDAGRVNLCMNYRDYVHEINNAFYSGFLLAMCKTQEDFDSITLEICTEAALLAEATAQTFSAPKEAPQNAKEGRT